APLPRPGRRSLRASFLAPRVKPQTAATPRRRPRSSPAPRELPASRGPRTRRDRKSTRLNSSHVSTSYAVFCLKKKTLERCRVPWVTGCCLLVRRECLEELGGLDEDYFLYYEDVDLCLRARKRGWTVWYEPNLA